MRENENWERDIRQAAITDDQRRIGSMLKKKENLSNAKQSIGCFALGIIAICVALLATLV